MTASTRPAEPGRPTRSLRFAAYLALLYGGAGAVSGVVGAGTFIPYGSLDNLSYAMELQLTAISIIGAIVSVFGLWAGWRLLHGRRYGWGTTMGAAFAAIGSVAAMAIVWPPSGPFLGVVAFCYALEMLLLFAGIGSVQRHPSRAVPA